MTFKCPQCPHREFSTKIALQQHYRSALGHLFCHDCDRYFYVEDAFEAHNAALHPRFECTTCKTAFNMQAALDDHYRGKPSTVHPNCSRCGKGFFNKECLEKHIHAVHPQVKCTCGVYVCKEDLAAHYWESVEHPSCGQCSISFKDNAAYHAHLVAVHADSSCTACHPNRLFSTPEDLKDHFLASPLHPQCTQCPTPVGFLDDAALRDHFASVWHADCCTACHPNRQFSTPDDLKAHFLLSPFHPQCTKCPTPVGFLDDAALREHFVMEHTSTPTFRDLAIGVPAPRPTQGTLRPPDKETNELWKSTMNKVVPPIETGLSTALVCSPPVVQSSAAQSVFPLSQTPWCREASSEAKTESSTLCVVPARSNGERPNSRLFKASIRSTQEANRPKSFEKAADVVSRRQDLQTTPRPSNNREQWVSVSNQGVVESGLKTISPQSSSSSLQSSSCTELSESSSGAEPRIPRAPPARVSRSGDLKWVDRLNVQRALHALPPRSVG
ncbi:hypothetical protein C8R44DRAFT_888948 [Mycena epipterygia]|nr:hypothetical protein C8R44DRAFT_888948 [Mycena epipterygia]